MKDHNLECNHCHETKFEGTVKSKIVEGNIVACNFKLEPYTCNLCGSHMKSTTKKEGFPNIGPFSTKNEFNKK